MRSTPLLKNPRPLAASLIKKAGEYRYYRWDFFVGLLIKFIFFVAMITAVRPENPHQLSVQIVGFVIWYFSAHILGKLGNIIIEEAFLGTLPQILVSRTSLRTFAVMTAVAEVSLSTLWVVLFVGLVWPILPIDVAPAWIDAGWVLWALLISFVCLVGIVGMGFVLFGLSIEYKRVGSFTEILTFFMLFFSGFFIPIDQFPTVVLGAAYASPLFWAIKSLSMSPVREFVESGMIPLFATTLVWLVAGFLCTRFFITRAKRKGTLTHY